MALKELWWKNKSKKFQNGYMRLFISIEPDPEVRDLIIRSQRQLSLYCGTEGFKYIIPENIHLTLNFLGELAPHRVNDIIEILVDEAENCSSGRYKVIRSGSFDNKGLPAVIWAGLDDIDHCIVPIQRKITQKLQKMNLPYEKRKFVPHFTICYVKNPPLHCRSALLQIIPTLITESNQVEGKAKVLSLKESILKPDGAVYRSLFDVDLQA